MKIILAIIMAMILLISLQVVAQADFSSQMPVIPAPPQSVVVTTQDLQSKVNGQDIYTQITTYISPQPAEEIIGFYKHSLEDAGWKLLTEVRKGKMAMISFLTKDNKITASILASNKAEGTEIYVALAQTLSIESTAGLDLEQRQSSQLMPLAPTEDTPGRDPNWAPRYPGSTRRMYQENEQSGQTIVVYASDNSVEDIVKFYSEMMPNSGWWLKDNVRVEKIPGFGVGNYQNLVFESGQANCIVSVNRSQDLSKYGQANGKLTAILLTYSPKR